MLSPLCFRRQFVPALQSFGQSIPKLKQSKKHRFLWECFAPTWGLARAKINEETNELDYETNWQLMERYHPLRQLTSRHQKSTMWQKI
jgi:hypothetical protein